MAIRKQNPEAYPLVSKLAKNPKQNLPTGRLLKLSTENLSSPTQKNKLCLKLGKITRKKIKTVT